MWRRIISIIFLNISILGLVFVLGQHNRVYASTSENTSQGFEQWVIRIESRFRQNVINLFAQARDGGAQVFRYIHNQVTTDTPSSAWRDNINTWWRAARAWLQLRGQTTRDWLEQYRSPELESTQGENIAAFEITVPTQLQSQSIGDKVWGFYSPQSTTLTLNLSSIPEPRQAIAIDTQNAEAEIQWLSVLPAEQVIWPAPYQSDWLIIVGELGADPNLSPTPSPLPTITPSVSAPPTPTSEVSPTETPTPTTTPSEPITPSPTPTSTIITLVSSLNGEQETPPVTTTATGSATATYDSAQKLLSLTINSNIDPASITGAHIHQAGPGAAGAIIVDLGTDNWDNTTGTTIKQLTNLSFPKNSESSLLEGNTYINIHTTSYPDGEIRGQIRNVSIGGPGDTPTPTPTPSNISTPTISATSTPTGSLTPSPTSTPTSVVTGTPTITPIPSGSITPSPSPTGVLNPTPTVSSTITPTNIPTPPFNNLPATFVSCQAKTPPGDWSNSPQGFQQISGQAQAVEGQDAVYYINDGNFLQCLCLSNPENNMNSGIQTLWWNVDGLTAEQISQYQNQNWHLESGSDWNLMNHQYLTINSSYNCVDPIGGGGEESGFQASYWNIETNTQAFAIPDRPADLSRTDYRINYDWNQNSPAPEINSDYFVARLTKQVSLDAGRYRFVTYSDDGLRLWVDDQLIIDQWNNHSVTQHTADINLDGGNHTLRIEYYERTVYAVLRFDYLRLGDQSTSFLDNLQNAFSNLTDSLGITQ